MGYFNLTSKTKQGSCRTGPWAAQALVVALTVIVAFFASAQMVLADGAGNTDTAVDGCMQDVAGFDLVCTANDIEIAGVALDANGDPLITITDDGCAFPGDTVTFDATFEVLLTAQARHDIGLWFATDGDPNGDGALTGECTVGTPAYAPDPPWLDLDGTGDTFLDTNVVSNIQDTCGDIDDAHSPLFPTMTITAQCVAGPDGNLSLPNCTSWKQPGDNDLCTSPLPVADVGGAGLDSSGVPPGAPSKCRCDDAFTVPIRVPGFITVDKVTVDSDDNPLQGDQTLFDFSITGPTVGPTNPDLPDDFSLADADAIHTSPPLETTDEDTNVVGPYQVTETVPTGWELDSVSCTSDNATPNDDTDDTTFDYTNGGDIQPLPGEVVACTFTNKQLPGTLTLVKTVVNDDGGTLVVADFPLFMNEDSVTSGQTVTFIAGTEVTASETEQSGYAASAWGGSCAADGTVTIEAGVDKICTITNDDIGATLRLQKTVINDNGGTEVAGNWNLTATGDSLGFTDAGDSTTFHAVTAGAGYGLSELGPAGYTAGDWSCDGGSLVGSTITLALAQSVTCTIVNDDDTAHLTLVKEVVNNNGGTAVATDWTLDAAGPTPISGAGGADSDVDAGSYALSETTVAGYTAGAWSCVGGSQSGASISLAVGESATCTIVNDDDTAHLTLVKEVVNNNGGTAVATDWTLDAAGPTPISGAGGADSDVDAGSYALSETTVAGYTAGAWSCVGGSQSGASISLAVGESATCTIVNDDDTAHLTLVKEVVNNNGGTAVATDWTLDAAGPTPISGAGGADSDVDAGSYALSETTVAGYTAGAWSCVGGSQSGASISLAVGESATCTIVNDDDTAHLTLVKEVVNNNGGTAVATDWTLDAAGPTPISGAGGADSDVDAGSYALSETTVAGYTAGAWSCVGGSQSGASISLAVGESATCTIVNDDDTAHLTLVKEVVNNNGGTAVATDWTLDAAGPTPISGAGGADSDVDAGSYALSETTVAGYTAGAWSCVGGSQSGASISLAVGESATCTIVNDDDTAHLTLVKEVVNNNGGTAVATDWTLDAAGPTPISGAGGADSDVDAGSYALSETTVAGYTAGAWSCVGGSQSGASISLAVGESATCTIVNDDDTAHLTLVKEVVNNNGGTAVATDWTLDAAGPTPISGAGGADSDVDAGSYALSETTVAGYTAGAWSCVGGSQSGASISLAVGESATCTIVNDDDTAHLTLVKEVVNNNGGGAVATDWILSASGPTPISGAGGADSDVDAGSYALSEIGGLDGYEASVWSCVGGSQSGANVSLALGESATCTIINSDIPPSLVLVKTVTNDDGGGAVETDWTLSAAGATPISGAGGATSDATFVAGTYDLSESTGPDGYAAGSWSCAGGSQSGAQISLALGESAICTINNDDVAPTLKLVKLVDNGDNPGGTAAPNDWTLSATRSSGEGDETRDISTLGDSGGFETVFANAVYDLAETTTVNGYQVKTDWSCDGGTQVGSTITLGLDEDVTCTIENEAQGMVDLLKLTNGLENQTMQWNFTLTGPEVDESDSSPPTTVDFGGAKLIPGEEYTLCETGIPAGWSLMWVVDVDVSRTINIPPDILLPFVGGEADLQGDGLDQVYDPDPAYGTDSANNDTRCVNFTVETGQTVSYIIDNQYPGGEPRTIGYWKNWNMCSGGNQYLTAELNGGTEAGWYILDDVLPVLMGDLLIEDCVDARNILDKRDLDGKKRASDAAYNLAAQLLGAKANVTAGAEQCAPEPFATIAAADDLLSSIGFDGIGKYLRTKDPEYNDAVDLAYTLDEYNNGNLCP